MGAADLLNDDPSFDPSFSVEPIPGWRAWRLMRHDGRLTLVSLTQATMWTPKRPMCSECRSCGQEGPGTECSCGLYAASTPENLALSGYFASKLSVVGTIEMWGRVIEHSRGARARFAYPARLRLACASCLRTGAGAVDPKVVCEGADGVMVAYCAKHCPSWSRKRHDAESIRSELLSTYAVDLLPSDRIDRSLKRPGIKELSKLESAARVLLGIVVFILHVLGFLVMVSLCIENAHAIGQALLGRG